jgi:hypothetical protein
MTLKPVSINYFRVLIAKNKKPRQLKTGGAF